MENTWKGESMKPRRDGQTNTGWKTINYAVGSGKDAFALTSNCDYNMCSRTYRGKNGLIKDLTFHSQNSDGEIDVDQVLLRSTK